MTLFLTKNLYFRNKIPSWHLFLLGSYFHTRPITPLFKILWGDGCIGVPHLKFWGRTVPSPPLSLRPCSAHSTSLYQLLARQSSFKMAIYLSSLCLFH